MSSKEEDEFDEIENLCLSLEMGEIESSDERLPVTLSQAQLISVTDRLSQNETSIDVKTEDLKYLLIDFYRAQLQMSIPTRSPEERLKALEKASAYYFRFADTMEQIKAVAKRSIKRLDELRKESGESVPRRVSRDEKIEQYKRLSALRDKVKVLRERKDLREDEETFRQFRMMMMYEAVEKTISVIPTLQQERGLLRRHVLNRRRDSRDAALKGDSSTRSEIDNTKRKKNGDGLMLTHIRPATTRVPPSIPSTMMNSSSVVTTYDDSRRTTSNSSSSNLIVRREILRDGVFRPDHNLPTMSLEEFARREVEEAKRREERQKNAPKSNRRYEHLHRDGDEDDENLADKATIQDREWDNWKDDNVKGAGVTKRI